MKMILRNQNGIKITVICRLNKSGSETFYVMNYYLEEESDGDE